MAQDPWSGFDPAALDTADDPWGGQVPEDVYNNLAQEDGQRLFAEDESLFQQGLDVLKDQADRTALPPIDAEQADGIWQYFNAGFDNSVGGLMLGRPELVMEENPDMMEHFAWLIGQTAGDIPTLVAGFAAGAAAAAPSGATVGAVGGSVVPGAGTAVGAITGGTITGTIAGGAMAMALTEGSRRWLLEGYAKGETRRSMAERMAIAGGAAGKWGLIGGVTAGAGAKVTRVGQALGMNPLLTTIGARGTEVATMVSAASIMEGQLPEPKDFVDAGVLVAGLTGAGYLAGKSKPLIDRTVRRMKDEFIASGLHPAAQANEALLNANKRAGLLREEDTPVARKLLAEAADEVVKPDVKLFDSFYTTVIDDLNPLRMATRALGFTRERMAMAAKDDPYILARLARGAQGRVQARVRELHRQLAEFDPAGKQIGKVRTVLGGGPQFKFSSGFLGELREQLIAARAVELEMRGIKSGLDADGIAAAQARLKAAPENIRKAADKIYEWQDANLLRLKDAGLISKKQLSDIMKANRVYIPFKRAFSELEKDAMGKGRGAGTVLKTIRGSERKILDPFETIMENAYVIEQRIAGNKVTSALVNLGIGKRVKQKRVPMKLSRSEAKEIARKLDLDEHAFRDIEGFQIFRPRKNDLLDTEIEVYVDGKRQVYEVGKEMAKAARALDPVVTPAWFKLFTAAPNLLRAMTIISPDFILRNVMRDNITAGVYSKSFLPFKDFFKGLASFAKQDKWYDEWQKSGGENTALASADKMLSKHLFGGAEKTNFQPTPWNVIGLSGKAAISPYRALQRLSEAAENATRIGEFRRVIEKTGDKPLAAFRSREVTLDFARKGGHTLRVLNQLSAFLNVQIQGIDRFARAYKENPKGAMMRTFAMVTAPSIMLWYHNHDQEWYREMPEWRKNMYWLASFDDGETIYSFPKPHEIGVLFGSVPERILDEMFLDDPNAVDSMMYEVLALATPDLLPTTLRPFTEILNNRVGFTGAPVIRSDIQNMLPEYQYTEHSTMLAKQAALFMSEMGLPMLTAGGELEEFATPVAFDHITNSWAGTMGRNIIRTIDKMWKETAGDVEPPDWGPEDFPFIRAFVVRHPTGGSESIRNFMDISQTFMKASQTFDKMVDTGDVDAAQRIMRKYKDKLIDMTRLRKGLSEKRKLIRQIHGMPGMPGEEKRQLMDQLYSAMIVEARGGLDIIKAIEAQDEEDGLGIFSQRRKVE